MAKHLQRVVARRLMGWFAMSPQHIDQLWPGLAHFSVYPARAEGWSCGDKASPDDLLNMRRMEQCLLAMEADKTWEQAIEIALQRWPVTCRESPKS